FAERNSHCRVAYLYKTDDGYRLGKWVSKQRKNKDTKDPERRQRLEALPGWSWSVIDDKWEGGFSHLKEFVERNGHCRIPQSYKTEDGYRLGSWAHKQRQNKDTMPPHRRKRLEALPGWSWDPLSDKWENGFLYLKQFLERNGHCRVPGEYQTE